MKAFLYLLYCCYNSQIVVDGFHSPSFTANNAPIIRKTSAVGKLGMVLSSPEKKKSEPASSLSRKNPIENAKTVDLPEKRFFDAQQCLQKDDDESPAARDSALSLLGAGMDIRRFDTLVHAGPMDFKGIVHEISNPDLDWNTTIFYTIKDPQITERLIRRFGQRPFWPDSVIRNACEKAVHLPPRQYTVPPDILNFMMTECEFKNEHADGSFTDHLTYCSEYCARYFPNSSPNVLFLHSICGVNTNLFPLEWSKISQLETLLTPHEFLHVQAFPCMLRLLFGELVDVLWDTQAGQKLKGISITAFHGEKLTLEGNDFWIHLNYHLIHMLDFLPTQNFDQFAVTDAFTRLFLRLHEFLRTEGKLLADIRVDRLGQVPGMAAAGQILPTWDHIVSRSDPEEIESCHRSFIAQLQKYSDAIDHDMSFELHWK